MTPLSYLPIDLIACIAIASMGVGFLCAVAAVAAYLAYSSARNEASRNASSAEHYHRLYEGQREITRSKEAHISSLIAMQRSLNLRIAMTQAVGTSPLSQ